ncbi:hypothetical protein BT63DRAFT_479141 [Microthyrium microscopicum]|uniref:Zn(2)-C6 fungal-type domain-containing protein n=1 Tax=Microthyrium microscopicum TaxID=703497 RepID=A0A6A6UAI7_9PEZI|nr:hypothetical protein BT63DRAFT_479141 [Microthyrium microscopicum]
MAFQHMAEDSKTSPGIQESISPDGQTHQNSISPSTHTASSSLNPRSCVTCRRRKVKCDKKHPCSNCIRQSIECIFPAPGRAPRKPRKPQDQELVERLRRLESVVQTLGAQVSPEDSAEALAAAGLAVPHVDGAGAGAGLADETTDEKFERLKKEFRELKKEKKKEGGGKDGPPNMDHLADRFGTLLVKAGRTRYIKPGFWSLLNEEVEDLKGEVMRWSDSEEDDYPSPSTHVSNSSSTNQGFIFGLSSLNIDISTILPPADQIYTYWETFKENVDPMIKLVHIPTRDKMIENYATKMENWDKNLDCLVMAICYSAVQSTWPEDCKIRWGESKNDLLARYRFGMEQSLARAEFLRSDSIFLLQAFILYLTCLRRNTESRVIWSLSSLALRIAQGLGMHRDGDHYPTLQPFQREMRRRIWWHAVVVDSRASEDLGADPAMYAMADTKMPRNLNDSDITFDMESVPESRVGITDLTFNIIRFEIGMAKKKLFGFGPMRGFKPMHKGPPPASKDMLERKKKILLDFKTMIEEKYLKDADLSQPLAWVCATIARLVISNMWLMLYQPFQRKDGGKSLPQEVRNELFERALECVEYGISFRTEGRSEKYRRYAWLLQTYTQWHAIAFLLSELCERTTGPEVDRAWTAVDLSMDSQWDTDTTIEKPDAHLWKPLKLLRGKALHARTQALAEQRANTSFDFSNPSLLTTKNELTNMNAETTTNSMLNPTILGIGYAQTGGTNTAPLHASDAPNSLLGMWTVSTTLPGDPMPAGFPAAGDISAQPAVLAAQPMMPGQPSLEAPTSATQQQLPLPDFSNEWLNEIQNTNMMGVPLGMEVAPGMGTVQPNTGLMTGNMTADDSMNWTTWDDMVQDWAMQPENQANSNGMGPTFFGGGSNWF